MLSEKQAYSAMFIFLEGIWERTKSEELAIILGNMSILPDGGPADPAILSDWKRAVDRALGGEKAGQLDIT